MAMQVGSGGKVDRQSTTPFHLKLFYRTGGFRRLEEFHPSPTAHLPPHVQVYTWSTCTFRELSHLLTTALPLLLPDPAVGSRLSYRLISQDTRDLGRPGPGRYQSKELASVIVGSGSGSDGVGPGLLPSSDEAATLVAGGPMSGELAGEPEKTLHDVRFVIGDYISCAIFPPLPNGSVAPAPAPAPASTPAASGRLGAAYGRGPTSYAPARHEMARPPRENGYGEYRSRGAPRAYGGDGAMGNTTVPSGEWRRGERVPDGPGSGSGYGRPRGRGRY
ncbi:MAG: hypothetical protein M1826_000269 [Phylliscum demangeonii]|nr:MAG: hypothetical protein M1826_000269 [Phylliscum demangeonii]